MIIHHFLLTQLKRKPLYSRTDGMGKHENWRNPEPQMDVNERKLIIHYPKSGKERKVVFILKKIAARLKSCIEIKRIEPCHSHFPYGP